MKTTLALLAALVAAPAAARADNFETSAPALDTVLAQARKADKPVLLDFSTVW
jgi:hypothetical protein